MNKEENPEPDKTQPASFEKMNATEKDRWETEVTPENLPEIANPRPKSKDLEDLNGTKLGEFTLLRRLGFGGMAEVYLARQNSLNRNVAVKVLRPEMISDESHRKRFEQEAVAAGSLNHPNIVQVFMIGENDGIHYIAQEYVEGQNLRELIDNSETVPVELALEIMIQIGSALETAGEAGIVHRDIKPENVLLDEKRIAKITDFGLAQLSIADDKLNLTQVGMTMGTPLYMSPEQVHGGELDQRSDIYSFGVTCYHLLAGEPPFKGETAISVALQHLNKIPEPLKEKRPDLPTVLCELVHRMMAKNPEERYPDAGTVLKDLLRIQAVLQHHPESISKLGLLIPEISLVPSGFFNRVSHFVTGHQALSLSLCSAAIFLFALMIGAYHEPRNPLDSPIVKNEKVPKKPTAGDQFTYASNLKINEAAWIAVIDYFPDEKDELWGNLTKVQLAALYLRTRRYDEANEIYDEFAAMNPKDKEYRAIGYAGQSILASLAKAHILSQQIIVDHLVTGGLHQYLYDRDLRRMVIEAMRQNKKGFVITVSEDIEALFTDDD